jgi:hypothetical protein
MDQHGLSSSASGRALAPTPRCARALASLSSLF